MAKSTPAAVANHLKEIRASLETKVDEKYRVSAVTGPRSSVKVLGVKPSVVKSIAKEFLGKARGEADLPFAVALADAAAARKTREEFLVALEVLERHRRDFAPGLFSQVDRWSGLADDLEVAEALGTKIAAPVLGLDSSKLATVRKWARMKSVGRKRLALLAAWGLVTDGRRDAFSALEICELLLNEEHPALVAGVAALLRETTKVDAKAVQDFLFRRSVDGNPDILRAGSENLDAARRAALIAKLEAQAGIAPLVAAGR